MNFRDFSFVGTSLQFLWDERNAQGLYHSWSSSTIYCCSNHRTLTFIIYLNTDSQLPNPIVNQSNNFKQGLIAHELGHTLGLEDFSNLNNNTTHIMNYASNPNNVYVPNSNEFTQANNFWH